MTIPRPLPPDRIASTADAVQLPNSPCDRNLPIFPGLHLLELIGRTQLDRRRWPEDDIAKRHGAESFSGTNRFRGNRLSKVAGCFNGTSAVSPPPVLLASQREDG